MVCCVRQSSSWQLHGCHVSLVLFIDSFICGPSGNLTSVATQDTPKAGPVILFCAGLLKKNAECGKRGLLSAEDLSKVSLRTAIRTCKGRFIHSFRSRMTEPGPLEMFALCNRDGVVSLVPPLVNFGPLVAFAPYHRSPLIPRCACGSCKESTRSARLVASPAGRACRFVGAGRCMQLCQIGRAHV